MTLRALLAVPALLLAGCAAPEQPFACLLAAEQAAGMASSLSAAAPGVVLDATYVPGGCIIVPEEQDYALPPGAATAGTLALGAGETVLTISALRVSSTFQRRATITARFDLPLEAGVMTTSAEVVRRSAATSGAAPEIVETTSVEASVTLTSFDLETGRVEGTFSSGFGTGGDTLASFYGDFSAVVEVTGAP